LGSTHRSLHCSITYLGFFEQIHALLDYISWVLQYSEGGIGIRTREGGSVDQMISRDMQRRSKSESKEEEKRPRVSDKKKQF